MAALTSHNDLNCYVHCSPKKSLEDENTIIILLVDVDDESRSRIFTNRLSLLVDHFLTYSCVSDCINYVEHVSKATKIIIVAVNEVHSRAIILSLLHLKQIIVLCTIDDAEHFSEKRVHRFETPSLVLEHIETITSNTKNQIISFRLLNQVERSMLNLSKESATFMWGQLTLVALQKLPADEKALDDMVIVCTDYYHYDDLELQLIDEFHRTYKATEAIKWYSRSCFVFRLVNRILRIEDIDGIFSFRQFIVDLHMQIVEEHHKQRASTPFRRVYRGQRLTVDELEQFKNSIGNLISINAFFSTSLDRRVAELFLEDVQNGKCIKVLFTIDVDMNLESTVCADISALSVVHDECEVLFSLSSIFRLENVYQDHERNIWEIHLAASDEGRDALRDYQRMMLETAQSNNAYLHFGQLLINRGLYKKADVYCNSLTKIIPCDDLMSRVSLHILHGRSLLFQSEYERSLAILTQALSLLEDIGKGCESIEYFRCQFNIANVYMYTSKYELALKLYQEILDFQSKILPSDHYQIAESLSGVSWAFGSLGYIDKALDYAVRSLEMRQRILPTCHPTIPHALLAVGNQYERQGKWTEAFKYIFQAHEIATKYLPRTHVRYAFSLLHIAELWESQGAYDSALNYYSEALKIYEINYKNGHPSTAHTFDKLGNIHRQKKEFEQAFQYLHKSLDMKNNILPPNHLSFAATFHILANTYLDIKNNTAAIDYFVKALERKKIYLKLTHSNIAETMSCLATAYSHDGQFELANETFEQALNIQQSNPYIEHPNIATTMYHMASNFRRMKNHVKALEFYEKSLAMARKYLDFSHTTIKTIEDKVQHLLNDIAE